MGKTLKRKWKRTLRQPLWGKISKNGKRETEGWVVGSRAEMDERKWKQNGKCEKRNLKQAPEEQLWERIREGWKETNSKSKYQNREGMHEKSGKR